MGPPVKWRSKITPYRTPARDRGHAPRSRRATRELRDVLRERLRCEFDSLRERQVRMEGRGDVVDREPNLDRERWLRDHLTGLGCEDVSADDLLGTGVRHELDESPRVARRERPRHVLEPQLRYEWVDPLSARLLFRKTDGSDHGIGECHLRQRRQVVPALVSGQGILSRQRTTVRRHVHEHWIANHIARGVYVEVGRL